MQQAVKHQLSTHLSSDNRGLVVLDNTDDSTMLAPYLSSLPGEYIDVLITTRDRQWANAIEIGTYEPHEAIAYVCNTLISSGKWALLSSDELPQGLPADINWQDYLREHAADTLIVVTNFVEAASHYPIALTHSLAYCVKNKKQLTDYLTDFKHNLDFVIKGQPGNNPTVPSKHSYLDQSLLGDNYGRTIYVTFKFSLDAIVAECKTEEGVNCPRCIGCVRIV